MLTFSTLTAEAADYPRMLDLYLSAFPAEERRDVSDLVRLMCGEPRFHVLAAYDEAGFAGFITYWDFSAFRYVEHFAISDACRGKGYGGAVIEHVKSATDLPILLEVEPPVTEQAVRRIRFYEKHGFCVSDYDYRQPPYRDGDEELVLRLMTTQSESRGRVTASMVETLRREVYGVQL